MKKSDLLKELKAISLRATPTVATMDMGLEYDYADGEGAGRNLGAMGAWPIHRIRAVPKEQMAQIRMKLASGNLDAEDLKGCDLDAFWGDLCMYHGIDGISVVDFFMPLKEVPPEYQGDLFILCDIRAWEPSIEVYISEAEVSDAFEHSFVGYKMKWDDMDMAELESWHARLSGDLSSLRMNCYDDEEEGTCNDSNDSD